MSQQIVEDYLLVNINVPDRAENTFAWLLTAITNLICIILAPLEKIDWLMRLQKYFNFPILSPDGIFPNRTQRRRQHHRETLYIQVRLVLNRSETKELINIATLSDQAENNLLATDSESPKRNLICYTAFTIFAVGSYYAYTRSPKPAAKIATP